MITRILAGGAAVVILHWGLNCPIWVAIAASAVGIWLIYKPSAAGKTIFVMDQATGRMEPQPLDRAGERYLNTRKES